MGMYWKDIWRFIDSIEYEYKWAGKYGAKGEKRGPRKKATPEQIKKQNQYKKENYLRRVIKANFRKNDLWCTLKYPKGTRSSLKEVEKEVSEYFIRTLRRKYKQKGAMLKFVYRIEIGRKGGIHVHFLCNRMRGDPEADIMIQKAWKYGRVNFESLYDAGGFANLASYLVKEIPEEIAGQMNLFDERERGAFSKFSSSRNLTRPKPERKTYKSRTVRKLLRDGPKPTQGYYIDKCSVVSGINKYTGMSYLHYTEIRIEPGGDDG